MAGPIALPLGVFINQTVAGVTGGPGFELYSYNTFTITHKVNAGTQIAWTLYDLPAYGPEKKEAWGEIEEQLGVELYDSHGHFWGGGHGHPSGQALGGTFYAVTALEAGDTVVVTGYNPPVGTPPPPLSLLAVAVAANLGGGPARLLFGKNSAPEGGTGYAGGVWLPLFKGNAGQPGFAHEITTEFTQDNEVPGYGEGEESFLGKEIPSFHPTPGEEGLARRGVEAGSLDDTYKPTTTGRSLTHTITPGDFTLGEGPLKHGGWRLDMYVKIAAPYVADAGHGITECMDSTETYEYPKWAVNNRNAEFPHALNLLASVVRPADYSSLVNTYLLEILEEGTIPTQPETYDVHLAFQQTGITNTKGRHCGGAPYESGHGVGYWLIPRIVHVGPLEYDEATAPLVATEPEKGDLYVGGVLTGSGVPLEWSEADAITGVELVTTGKEVELEGALEPGEEVVGGKPPLALESICPVVSSVFNTLTYTWEAHVIVYFPPNIPLEELEKKAKELEEEEAKRLKEEEEQREKEEEEQKKEEEEGEGGEGEEGTGEETEEEKERREEREAEEPIEEAEGESGPVSGTDTRTGAIPS